MSHKSRSYFGYGGGDSDEDRDDDAASDSEVSDNASDSGASELSKQDADANKEEINQNEDDDDIPDSDNEGEGGDEEDDDASVDNAIPGSIANKKNGEDEDDDDEEDEEDDDDDGDNENEEYQDIGAGTGTGVKKRGSNLDVNSLLDETNASDEEDEDENDENYLQKFSSDLNKSYILEHHPECVVQNYNEILALCTVIRDKWNDIVDPLHRTCPYLSKYERTRILGQRAKQINDGAPAFVKVPETMIDGYLIAEMELEQKKIPFIIRRPLPNGASEYWRMSDLENIAF
jgi:DNA-directed RNA polymerase subunit K/omega